MASCQINMLSNSLKKPNIKFDKRTLLIIILLIFLLQAVIFTYFYFTKQNPASLLHNSGIPGLNGSTGSPAPLFGIYGNSSTGGLQRPMGVTVDGRKIFVSDTNNRRIVVFDYDGNPLYTFGKLGEGKGEFKFPYGIAVDNSGLVYVADLLNGKISVFNQDGEFIKYFAEDKKNIFSSPAGLCIYENKVFVTDVQQNKVMVFTLSGDKILEFGKEGTKDGDLSSPNAVAVTNDSIYVSDTANDRVEKFDRTGKFIKTITGTGSEKQSAFVNVRGVAVDGRGILYVVSNLTNKVWGFDKDGKKAFEPFGQLGSEDNQFLQPNGMFIDNQGRIYIADSLNGRIMVYQN